MSKLCIVKSEPFLINRYKLTCPTHGSIELVMTTGRKLKLRPHGHFWSKGVSLKLQKLRNPFFWWKVGIIFLGFEKVFGFGLLANQSTVHSGGVSRGRVCD